MPFVNDEFVVKKVHKRVYMLMEPLVYEGKVDTWVVPAGFTTDYASIPAAVRWLFPQDDDYTIAAILHDWFCDVGIPQGLISARDADAVFRRVMKELGVPFARRWSIWAGVRWGALANKKRRKEVWKDMELTLDISLALVPFVLPPTILVVVAKWIESLFNWLLGLVGVK